MFRIPYPCLHESNIKGSWLEMQTLVRNLFSCLNFGPSGHLRISSEHRCLAVQVSIVRIIFCGAGWTELRMRSIIIHSINIRLLTGIFLTKVPEHCRCHTSFETYCVGRGSRPFHWTRMSCCTSINCKDYFLWGKANKAKNKIKLIIICSVNMRPLTGIFLTKVPERCRCHSFETYHVGRGSRPFHYWGFSQKCYSNVKECTDWGLAW